MQFAVIGFLFVVAIALSPSTAMAAVFVALFSLLIGSMFRRALA